MTQTATTTTTTTRTFVNIVEHMTASQKRVNDELLEQGYTRQAIVVAFIAGCYGVECREVTLCGNKAYRVKGLDATVILHHNIVKFLNPPTAYQLAQAAAQAKAASKPAPATVTPAPAVGMVTVTEVPNE